MNCGSCGRRCRRGRRGMCNTCYLFAHRNFLLPARKVRSNARECRCPCGERTVATATRHEYAVPVRRRVCPNGHHSAWTVTEPIAFLRICKRQAPDPRPCDFPDCGRTRKGRFCQGHAKQFSRYGFVGMKPLGPPPSIYWKKRKVKAR